MAWLKFDFDQGRITIQTDDVVVYETDDAPFDMVGGVAVSSLW